MAVLPLKNETRFICSLDLILINHVEILKTPPTSDDLTSHQDRNKDPDKNNESPEKNLRVWEPASECQARDEEFMVARIGAGATGRRIEDELSKAGYTLGHEPDSYEFSTMGGWIATRASGMKKNRYGNIEDLLLDVNWVSTFGDVSKERLVSRISSGPDLRQLILGSEGTLGIITSCVVKIRKRPALREFNSYIFRDFSVGVDFMKSVSDAQLQPSSLRLVDSWQVGFGRAVSLGTGSLAEKAKDWLKDFVLQSIYKLNPKELCLCSCVFEGNDPAEVRRQKEAICALVKRFGGLSSGGSSGKVAYNLTFHIAYIRDYVLDCRLLAESFECTCPWSQISQVIDNVRTAIQDTYTAVIANQRAIKSCATGPSSVDSKSEDGTRASEECVSGDGSTEWLAKGGVLKPYVTVRMSQVYPEAVCLYFYFGLPQFGLEDPMDAYTRIEHAARVALMEAGGTISHHHGVGKLRAEYMADSVSETGLKLLRQIKQALDPENIFAASNYLTVNESDS